MNTERMVYKPLIRILKELDEEGQIEGYFEELDKEKEAQAIHATIKNVMELS